MRQSSNIKSIDNNFVNFFFLNIAPAPQVATIFHGQNPKVDSAREKPFIVASQ